MTSHPHPEVDAFAVRAETGTGKTFMVLDEWQRGVGEGRYDSMLVVAPAGSYRNWYASKGDGQPSELMKHLDPALYQRLWLAPWASGAATRDMRADVLKNKLGREPCAAFVNVEALSASGKKAEQFCEEFLKGSRCLMVVDESTRIKTAGSKRTASVLRLGKLARGRRIMTGLIAPKSPFDVLSQFDFLDWRIIGFKSDEETAFRARYAEIERTCFVPHGQLMGKLEAVYRRIYRHGGRTVDAAYRAQLLDSVRTMKRHEIINEIVENGGWVPHAPVVKSYRNLDELHQKMAPWSFVVLKEECLDLEPKVYEPRDVELSPEQRRVYGELVDNCCVELASSDHVTASSVITQMLKLHQVVCGHVVDENGVTHDLPGGRGEALLEVLEEHGGKAIIWACYERMIRKVAALLRKEYGQESVAEFWGGNASTRHLDEARFLSDDRCRFMVSNQQVGGIGNTWNVARLTVYAAGTHNLEHRFQSEDRNHRYGQTGSVTYVDLVSRGTVEEKFLQAVRKKMDLAAIIDGREFKQWVC